MELYVMFNNKGRAIYKPFNSHTEARHYVINHLDLSDIWTITKLQ